MAPRGQNLFSVGKGKITLDIIVLCGPPKVTVHKQICSVSVVLKLRGEWELEGGKSKKTPKGANNEES